MSIRHYNIFCCKALNDHLSSKFDDRINGRDKKLIDCPINDADAILQVMFSGRRISVNWTIMGRCSLCYNERLRVNERSSFRALEYQHKIIRDKRKILFMKVFYCRGR